jgi:hypothetical protein
MNFRIAAVVGLLVAAATACTPQEVAFWQTFHDENPAEAEQLLDTLGLGDVAVAETPAERSPVPPTASLAPGSTQGYYISAVTSCPAAVTLLNGDVSPHTYVIYFGGRQTPLTEAVNGQLPTLGAAETVEVDLRPATGERATLFVDGAAMWRFDSIAC